MKQNKLDGRHKLAIVGAIICWGLSMYFSKLGFSVNSTTMLWVGWVLASIVTVVELVFNTPMQKLSLTLVIIGIVCYLYGIWTNVIGFWDLQHPDEAFVFFSTNSLMAWFVGFIMEVLPEPLLMWGLGNATNGDFFGNLVGMWSGKDEIGSYTPKKKHKKSRPPIAPKSTYRPKYKPAHLQREPSSPTNAEIMDAFKGVFE